MRSKYIVFEVHGSEVPVVFSDLFSHSDFSQIGKPISAGFCQLGKDGFSCYGRSVTLKIDSRFEKDSSVLNKNIIGSFNDEFN